MSESVPSISVEELSTQLADDNKTFLLDVREDSEFDLGHVSQAVHIPLSEIANNLDQLADTDEILVICRSGGRSARAVSYLNHNGFNAINVSGGTLAWEEAGKPLVDNQGNSGVCQ